MLRRRTHRSSVAAAAALATCLAGLALVPAHAQGHPGGGKFYTTKTPTSIGSGGAVSSVDPEAQQDRTRRAAARRQRRRREHRDGGRARGDRAVQLRHRRWRLLRLLRREVRQGQHDRRPRDRARLDAGATRSSTRHRQALQLQPRAGHQRGLGRHARHAGHLGPGAAPLRHPSFKQALQPATRLAARGFVVDSTFRQADARERAAVRELPRDHASCSCPDGHAPAVGSVLPQPRPGGDVQAARRRRASPASTPARWPTRS